MLGRSTKGVEQDTGIDAIYVTELGEKVRVGFIGRQPQAPVQLIATGLSQSQVREIITLADNRDCEGVSDEIAAQIRGTPRGVQLPMGVSDE